MEKCAGRDVVDATKTAFKKHVFDTAYSATYTAALGVSNRVVIEGTMCKGVFPDGAFCTNCERGRNTNIMTGAVMLDDTYVCFPCVHKLSMELLKPMDTYNGYWRFFTKIPIPIPIPQVLDEGLYVGPYSRIDRVCDYCERHPLPSYVKKDEMDACLPCIHAFLVLKGQTLAMEKYRAKKKSEPVKVGEAAVVEGTIISSRIWLPNGVKATQWGALHCAVCGTLAKRNFFAALAHKDKKVCLGCAHRISSELAVGVMDVMVKAEKKSLSLNERCAVIRVPLFCGPYSEVPVFKSHRMRTCSHCESTSIPSFVYREEKKHNLCLPCVDMTLSQFLKDEQSKAESTLVWLADW
jgi:hypothetical protein